MINIPVAFSFIVFGVVMEVLVLFRVLPLRPLYHRAGLFLMGTGIGFLIPIHVYIDSLVLGVLFVVWDMIRHRRQKRQAAKATIVEAAKQA